VAPACKLINALRWFDEGLNIIAGDIHLLLSLKLLIH